MGDCGNGGNESNRPKAKSVSISYDVDCVGLVLAVVKQSVQPDETVSRQPYDGEKRAAK